MKKLILILLFIFLHSLTVFPQTENAEKQDCPTVSVIPPPSVVRVGEAMRFSGKLTGNTDLDKFEYMWTVDKGRIIKGQGTDSIVVVLDEEGDTTVTATVNILNQKHCDLSASDTGIVCTCGDPVILDEFGELPTDDLRARFDNVFIYLQNDPKAKAVVINYGLDKDIKARKKLINNHMKFRGYDKNRIIFEDGGREKTIRTLIGLVPEGADPSVFK